MTVRFNPAASGALLVAGLSFAVLFASSTPADASAAAASGNPCPQWAIQDVFDDPHGDWDRDRVPNATELNHGESPCVPVKANFCTKQPALCTVRYVTASAKCNYGTYWDIGSVNADPNSDWDGDGLKNAYEVKYGTNPCAHPCPRPTVQDIALNPRADWDKDGVNNATEAWYRTDPCVAPTSAVPQPTPTPRPIVHQPVVVVQPTTPPAGYHCPAGYPYYYATTGFCHARRVTR